MRRKWILGLILGLVVVGLILSRTAINNTASQTIQSDPVVAMLFNLRDHGFDPTANNGAGGLALSWADGGHPATLMEPTVAATDALLVDTHYLQVLWQFTTLHPSDSRFIAERGRYTAIIKSVFPQGALLNSQWFSALHDLATLSGDSWYTKAAQQLVRLADSTLYHPVSGAIYWTDSQHPTGWYHTADTLETAAALVVEGQQDKQAQWVHDGLQALAFLNNHAYFPLYHIYFGTLTQVVYASGSNNPNEALAAPDGATISSSDIAREALALSSIAQAEHDTVIRAQAIDLLEQETPENNALHLWDDQHQGYNHAATFTGSDFLHPGALGVSQMEKFPGDQARMLSAFFLVGSNDPNHYIELSSTILQTLLNSAYQASSHGLVAQMTTDWRIPGTIHATWVDSATMTIALASVLQVTVATSAPSSPSPPSTTFAKSFTLLGFLFSHIHSSHTRQCDERSASCPILPWSL